MRVVFCFRSCPFFNLSYSYEDGQYSRTIYQGWYFCIQGDNNNNKRSNIQAIQAQLLEEYGLKITVLKQAQITISVDERMYRKETNTSINLTKVCTIPMFS